LLVSHPSNRVPKPVCLFIKRVCWLLLLIAKYVGIFFVHFSGGLPSLLKKTSL
jgi:hypothetical protein